MVNSEDKDFDLCRWYHGPCQAEPQVSWSTAAAWPRYNLRVDIEAE
jgi:hypothetical protein